jgi:hypothetical protein
MATGDHPFPMLAWSGVTHPYQGIQQWRMYGHAGAGTENTGWRNYGAVGYNTSDGAGTRGTWFREGTPVQRTQFRAPNAGVSQRFTGDQIRPNTPPSMAGGIQNTISAIKEGREQNRQMQEAAAQKQAQDEAVKQRQLFKVNQGVGQFKTPQTPLEAAQPPQRQMLAVNQNVRNWQTPQGATSPIKGSLAQVNWSLNKAFPSAPPATERPVIEMSEAARVIQNRAIAGVEAMRAERQKPAETPSTSRLSKRNNKTLDRGLEIIRGMQGSAGTTSILDDRV